MNHHSEIANVQSGAHLPRLNSYVTGFILSIVLTAIAFIFAGLSLETDHGFIAHGLLVPLLVALAIVQLLVQLVFFLHVGKESKTHWNVTALAFAVLIVAILVGGTLWIMDNVRETNQMDMFVGGVVSPEAQAN